MTNEQWAFCAGLGTGVAIFVVGMVVGALIWHAFLVAWTKRNIEARRRTQEQLCRSFASMTNKEKKE